jgi:hypothetical protein
MMRTMRSIAPWIMAIVAVSFVGWMVFEVGMDVRGQSTGAPLDEVARVNGQKIDVQTFYAAVRQTQEMQRQQGAPPTTTLEEQRQLEDQVLEQIVQQILLNDEYRRQEITVTDDELRQALRFAPLPELREVEIFQTDGQFDLEKYQRYLLSGADPNFALALEQRYREELPRIKYFERIAQGANVSGAKLWQVYRDQNDSVTATVVALVPAVLVADEEIEVSEDDLRAYYEAHADEYEQPAQAHVSYVTISRVPNAASARGPFARRSSPAPTSRPWPPASPPTRPTATRAAISVRSSAALSCRRSKRRRWRCGRDSCPSRCSPVSGTTSSASSHATVTPTIRATFWSRSSPSGSIWTSWTVRPTPSTCWRPTRTTPRFSTRWPSTWGSRCARHRRCGRERAWSSAATSYPMSGSGRSSRPPDKPPT